MENIILFSVIGLIAISSFYIGYRNHVAFKIRTKILYLDPSSIGLDLYEQLPTYKQMVFDFRKPLTYDYWVNYAFNKLKEKTHQKINRNDEVKISDSRP